MRKLQVEIASVFCLPNDVWSQYTVFNDGHGGLIAVVHVTDNFALEVEAMMKANKYTTVDEALYTIHTMERNLRESMGAT